MYILAQVIHYAIRISTLVILIQAVLSWVMSPYHPVRQAVDRVVNPFLAPIRRLLPPTGMVDLSPLILIIILQVLDIIVMRLLTS